MTSKIMTRYQPSNASEGESFINAWCGRCERDKCQNGTIPMDECNDDDFCEILGATMAFGINEDGYPSEWVKIDGVPQCRAFVQIGDGLPIVDAKTIDMFFCQTCNGHGMIGGLLPGDGGYQSEPCPDCLEDL